ncbi:MAG: CBS domain-containing protein [Xanthomonadales bacterium]|nr:CBS domain-containing protein [Xanthomonadales bacterium]
MKRSMQIQDYMQKNFLTLDPDMDVLRATQLLIRSNISGAPVLDKHGRLVGILTERDCMQVALQGYYHGEPGGLVKKHMSPDPEFVSPDKSILTLAEMFIQGRFQRYPVVDNGRLVGVIARWDVMRALAEYYPA